MVPGTGIEPAGRKAADFHHTASFNARRPQEPVCALDYAFTVAMAGVRCPPSSLYTFRNAPAWLGVVSVSIYQGVHRL